MLRLNRDRIRDLALLWLLGALTASATTTASSMAAGGAQSMAPRTGPAPATTTASSAADPISPPGEVWLDPEIARLGDGGGLITWQEGRTQTVWAARLDPGTGLLSATARWRMGDDAVPLTATFNGPEIGLDATGWSIYYSRGAGASQVARSTLHAGVPRLEVLTQGAEHFSPMASKDPLAAGSSVVYRCVLELPADGPPAIRLIPASATDPVIADLLGQHAVAVGPPGTRLGRLLVFYPGTGATADRYSLILTRAAELGYHAIGLAYDNRDAINWDICPGQPDRCYEDARLEILLGIESGYTPPSVDVDNSAFNRLTKLLHYLHARYPDEGWDAYLAGDGPRWDRIAFAGHSQGGGHAAMTAKLHEVARAILFDATEPKAWTAAAFATAPDRLYGFAHELEPIFAPITRSWVHLGLPGDLTNVEAVPPPFGDAHRLSTATNACRGDPASAGFHHGCPVVDDYTPLDPDGSPSLRYVWDVLLDPGPRPPAATSTVTAPAPATNTPAPPVPTAPSAGRALFLPLALADGQPQEPPPARPCRPTMTSCRSPTP